MDTREQELTVQEIWKLFRETQREFQETRSMIHELTEDLKKTRGEVSNLTDGWGRFVESMVEPAVVRLFVERGITLDGTSPRAKRCRNGQTMEIDVLGVNLEYVVPVEVKTTLRTGNVDKYVKKLKKFKSFFPEYRDHKVIGAVAGMTVPASVARYAEGRGLYVLAQSGERCPERRPELVEGPVEGTVRLLNDEDFEAHVW